MEIAQTMGGYSLGGRTFAPGDGQEDPRGDGRAARNLRDRRHRPRHPAGQGRRGVRTDGEVRRLRLQQVARRGLCAGGLPDGVDEDQPPVEFLAACMSLALGNTDKLAALRQEAERLGIACCRRTSTARGADFTVDLDAQGKPAIRYALAAVKKVGLAAMQSLVAVRGAQPFRDPTGPGEPGRSATDQQDADREPGARRACDGVLGNRAQFFAAAEQVLRRAQADAEQKESGQYRPVRRGRTAADPPPDGGGLAEAGAAGLRGRGDRLPPERASAGHVCRPAEAAGCDRLGQAGGGGCGGRDAGEARRLRGPAARSARRAPAARWPGCA